ncbi:MAG: hypothetical protein JO359_14515 [Candidatus Eremiobacteraeota bacterium]|nr:hypothetical protein [Candidatus Eremiobacteraeota bacterium]
MSVALLTLALAACHGGSGSALPPVPQSHGPSSSDVSTMSLPSGTSLTTVQINNVGSGPATSINASLRSAPTPGNLIVAAFIQNDGTESSLHGPAGWNYIARIDQGVNYVGMAFYWHVVQSGEANSYTFTAGSPVALGVNLTEIAGANSSSPIDQAQFFNLSRGFGSTTASASPANSGELALSYFAQYTGGNLGSGYASASGWSWGSTVNTAGNAIAWEAQVRNTLTSGSGSISGSEPWSGGENSAQVNALILINPSGSSGGGGGGGGPTPTPAPNAPNHVQVWAYYGLNGDNANISGSTMAANADYIETGDDKVTEHFAADFKNAGGKKAVVYVDGSAQSYCPGYYWGAPPCGDDLGKLMTSEYGYAHDSSGNRVYRNSSGGCCQYQEALDIGNSNAQNALWAFTSAKVAVQPAIDLFFTDQSGGELGSFTYGWANTPYGTTFSSDANFQNAQIGMFNHSYKPVVFNGRDYISWGPSYNGAYMQLSNTWGFLFENCWGETDPSVGIYGDYANRWTRNANSLLATQSYGKIAVCHPEYSTGQAFRLYNMASWWMTYDPNYSVMGRVMDLNNNSGDPRTLAPEDAIVPRNPTVSPTTDVSVLYKGNSVYAREFGQCYQNGSPIGPCAAVVNTSTQWYQSMPSLSNSYSRSLAISGGDITSGGGRASFSGSVPSGLNPTSGVILLH